MIPNASVLLALSDVPLRTASFALKDRCLLWSRAQLYVDRLTLYGWGLRGRYWRKVSFTDIEQVDQHNRRLILHLDGNRTLFLQMDAAPRWQTAIETHRDVYDG